VSHPPASTDGALAGQPLPKPDTDRPAKDQDALARGLRDAETHSPAPDHGPDARSSLFRAGVDARVLGADPATLTGATSASPLGSSLRNTFDVAGRAFGGRTPDPVGLARRLVGGDDRGHLRRCQRPDLRRCE
jgi:hypothetical protein